MSVTDCPVVSRAQIDRASERIELLRATLARGGELRRLCHRLLESGSGLPREDFLALAALAPILGHEYASTAIEVSRFLSKMLEGYRRHRYRKITPLERKELHLYWTSEWTLGHLAAICGERTDAMRVAKALASQRRWLEAHGWPEDGQMAHIVEQLEKLMDPANHETLRSDHLELGAHAYAAFTERFPAGSPMRITRAEDVPEDLALAILVNGDGDLYANPDDIVRTLTAVPWLASASGADLYLPAKFFESCGPLFSPEATLQRIDSYYRFFWLDGPVRAQERPGRNQPCSCGSGKKYKRCCGAAA